MPDGPQPINATVGGRACANFDDDDDDDDDDDEASSDAVDGIWPVCNDVAFILK